MGAGGWGLGAGGFCWLLGMADDVRFHKLQKGGKHPGSTPSSQQHAATGLQHFQAKVPLGLKIVLLLITRLVKSSISFALHITLSNPSASRRRSHRPRSLPSLPLQNRLHSPHRTSSLHLSP